MNQHYKFTLGTADMDSNMEHKVGSLTHSDRRASLFTKSTVGDLLSTILNGLCSFMLEEWESPIGFSGSIQADTVTRKRLAKESGLYNLEKYPIFMELFPGNQKIMVHNLF